MLKIKAKKMWILLKKNLKKILNLDKFNKLGSVDLSLYYSRHGMIKQNIRFISPNIFRPPPNIKITFVQDKKDYLKNAQKKNKKQFVHGKKRIWIIS